MRSSGEPARAGWGATKPWSHARLRVSRHRHAPWIAFAVGVAIASIACSDGKWAKDPLPVCEDGTEECGIKAPTRKDSAKGPSGSPLSSADTEATSDPPPTTSSPSDAGADADATSTAPKGPTCLSAANMCFDVTKTCGCAEDCCAGLTCAKVGGLLKNTCCKATGSSCTEHADCCGDLLCKPSGDAGAMTCQ